MKYALRELIDKQSIDLLAAESNYDKEFCRLLLMRGIDNVQKAEQFLNPSFENLSDINEIENLKSAADRIAAAIENDETVVIYGDYDCDGIAGVSILYDYLSRFISNVYYYIPDRETEGYGLNVDTLAEIAEEFLPDLIVTVDCGITSAHEIDFAQQELGIDIIVTDHHEPAEVLPSCIIVDQKVSKKGFYELCGAGVALRLVEALGGIEMFDKYIEAAAIATIADCVPLVGDNRIIAAMGIKSLANPKTKGLEILIESLALRRKVNAGDIAFKIAPRINSIGRLDDASRAVELFCSDDYFNLSVLTERLNSYNLERQRLCDEIFQECLILLEDEKLSEKKVIVLKNDKWDSGVLGIVCSRLVECFYRPTLLFSKDKNGLLKGSGRSIEGVNLFENLQSSAHFATKFGGHSMACGMSIAEENFDAFKDSICDKMRGIENDAFMPSVKYDIMCEMPPSLEFVRLTDKLAPFGIGNPEPLYILKLKSCKFEQISDKNHLKCKFENGSELVYFNGLDQKSLLNDSTKKYISVKFAENEFANILYAQGIVEKVFFEDVDDDCYDLFEAHYLKQLYEQEESITLPKKVDMSFAIEKIKQNIYGTCFLCYTKNTATSFLKALKESGVGDIDFCIGRCGKNPINTLILDLNKNTELCFFDRIIFLDKPLRYGYCDNLKSSRKCEFYEVEGSQEGIKKYKCPEYELLGKIFVSLKKVMLAKYRNIDDVYAALSKFMQCSYFDFYVAFCCFYDLKIIRFAIDAFYIDEKVRTKLSECEFYNKVKQFLG